MALPPIGFNAVLLLREYRRNVAIYNRLTRDIQKATRTTAKEVQKSSQLSSRYFDEFVQKVVSGGKIAEGALAAFYSSLQELPGLWEKMGRPEIDVDKFVQLANAGESMGDSLKGAAVGAEQAGVAMGSMAIAAGIAITAISSLIAVMRKATQEYAEFIAEMRRVQLVMGTTSSETAAWAKLAEDTGTSVGTLTRSMTYLERQLTDLKLRQIEGKEASTMFSRAIDALGISWQDAEGRMRPVDEVMRDVMVRMQELGPSSEASALALRLFGRAGAQDMLPFLFDAARSLEETEAQAKRLGVTMTEVDRKNLQQWRLATSDISDATKGLWLTIGRELIPELTKLAKAVVEVINVIRLGFAAISAADRMIRRTFVVGLKEAREEAQEYYNYLTGTLTEAQEQEEALAKAARQSAINTLFEAQAAEEAAKARAKQLAELQKLQAQYEEKLADAAADFDRRWEDMERQRERRAIERALRESWKLEDMARDHQEKLADIATKYADKKAELEQKRAEAVEKFVRDAQREREELEERHADRLYKIRTKYLDTVEEAARRNDAVAVARAMRERARALRDAAREKQKDERDLARDLAEKRQKLNEDYQQRKAEQETRYAEEVAKAREQYARRLADYERSKDRERQIREMHYQWEEEDLNRAYARQLADIEAWYTKEQAALLSHLQTMQGTAVAGITQAGAAIAAAASAAVQQVAAAAVDPWTRRHEYMGAATTPAPASTIGLSPAEQWRQRHSYFRQHGGLDIVSRPTSFIAGEGGPEALLSMPLRGQMNVNHQFSRLPIGFEGLPAGVNTAQVEGMVHEAMLSIAQQLLAGGG